MGTRERVIYAVVFLVLLLVIAWAVFILPADDPVVEPTAAPTPTVEASPTPTITDTPTPTETETPTPTFTPTERFTPTELPTGEDFQQVLQTIFDIRHEAFVRRDVRILGEVLDSKCDCSTQDQEAIRGFIEDGLLFEGAVPQIYDVSVKSRPDSDAIVLFHRVRPTDGTRVDAATGDVVETFPPFEVRVETGLLRNFGVATDGRWVVVAIQPITEDGE